jgi:hypothetical protein
MAIVPGWDSIQGSHWWGNFYFGASIVSLILLGAMEVISHRYGERKDELAAIEQESTEKAHENEIARLHVEAARLSADAEASKASIAASNKEMELARKDAAIAEQRANEAKLALEQLRSPRLMTPDWQAKIILQLSRFKGTRFDMALIPGDPEAATLLGQVSATIQAAGWQWVDFAPSGGPLTITYTWPGLPNAGQMGGFGIDIFVPPDRTDLSFAANALAQSFRADGFCDGTIHNAAEEQKFPNHDTIHVLIGKKPL